MRSCRVGWGVLARMCADWIFSTWRASGCFCQLHSWAARNQVVWPHDCPRGTAVREGEGVKGKRGRGEKDRRAGDRTDAARMMRCNHKPHSECSGVCQHTHIRIPLSVSSMTQIEHVVKCFFFFPHTHTDAFYPFCLQQGSAGCTVWACGLWWGSKIPCSCRISLPPLCFFNLRSSDHNEQKSWRVASGVKAFSVAVTMWFDLKCLLKKKDPRCHNFF